MPGLSAPPGFTGDQGLVGSEGLSIGDGLSFQQFGPARSEEHTSELQSH